MAANPINMNNPMIEPATKTLPGALRVGEFCVSKITVTFDCRALSVAVEENWLMVTVALSIVDSIPLVEVKSAAEGWVDSIDVPVCKSALVAEGLTRPARVAAGAVFVPVSRGTIVEEGTDNPDWVEIDWLVGLDTTGLRVAVLITGATVLSVGIGVPAPWVGTPVFVGPGTF